MSNGNSREVVPFKISATDKNMAFKKGNIPWNTGKKGLQQSYRKGIKGIYHNSLKGKKMPEEWRLKLMKPKFITHKHTEETKRKLSISKVGSNNPNWKGGKETKYIKRRKELLKNCEGNHTQGEWELLKKQYGYICPCCKIPNLKLTEDHIIPLSKGGSNWIENIQPLCLHCNVKKYTKIIKY